MDKNRYARQLSLDKIGADGQQALLDSHVLIVGCGGLGAIAAAYLAGAGVGEITLIDGDKVQLSNLHRQVLYAEKETGRSKSEDLKAHLQALNSDVQVHTHSLYLDADNVSELLPAVDIALECSDDIDCKYLVNDHCLEMRIPMVYGAIHKYEGMISFCENIDDNSIHLRDIFPEPDSSIPTCAEVGVLNTIAGIIGLLQANEAIKFITGCGPVLAGRLLTYDALSNEQQRIKLKKTWTRVKKIIETESPNTMSNLTFSEIPSISYDSLNQDLQSYRVISLLEDHEFVALCDHVERLPHSEYEWMEWKSDGRPTVFYCATGKRAMQVVYDLKCKDLSSEVFFLKADISELGLG